jgi:hypothetical protein
MAYVQRERPVANTPDTHRFDDWTGDLAADLASTLPNDDDRLRFYQSLIRAGAWAIYHDPSHGFWEASEFADAVSEGLKSQWKDDCEAKRNTKKVVAPTG